MKRIILLLPCLVWSSIIFAQKPLEIDITQPSIAAPEIDYYVLNVIDARDINSVIGMIKSEKGTGVSTLRFETSFEDQLYSFFTATYPAGTDKIPVVVLVKKLWIGEYSEETRSYSTCDLEVEFLTPRNQKFWESTVYNEIPLVGFLDSHRENIIVSLHMAMADLNNPEVPEKYNAVINSTGIPVSGSETKTDRYVKTAQYMQQKKGGRISFQGGYTYRTASISESFSQAVEAHMKNLKSGYNLGMDLSFFTGMKDAFGMSASYSNAKSTLEDVSVSGTNGITVNGDIEENISLYYIGPSYFHVSPVSGGGTNFVFGMTGGYYGYGEKFRFSGESMKITGGTVGFGMGFGFDFLASDDFAIGLQASALLGWINKMKMDGETVELNESENISRIDLTIGFRLYP